MQLCAWEHADVRMLVGVRADCWLLADARLYLRMHAGVCLGFHLRDDNRFGLWLQVGAQLALWWAFRWMCGHDAPCWQRFSRRSCSVSVAFRVFVFGIEII